MTIQGSSTQAPSVYVKADVNWNPSYGPEMSAMYRRRYATVKSGGLHAVGGAAHVGGGLLVYGFWAGLS
jgi:hypothetical protein